MNITNARRSENYTNKILISKSLHQFTLLSRQVQRFHVFVHVSLPTQPFASSHLKHVSNMSTTDERIQIKNPSEPLKRLHRKPACTISSYFSLTTQHVALSHTRKQKEKPMTKYSTNPASPTASQCHPTIEYNTPPKSPNTNSNPLNHLLKTRFHQSKFTLTIPFVHLSFSML